MDPIAFLVGPYSIYWSTVIQAMAALTGVLLFWFFYLWDERDCVGAFCVVPLAIAPWCWADWLTGISVRTAT